MEGGGEGERVENSPQAVLRVTLFSKLLKRGAGFPPAAGAKENLGGWKIAARENCEFFYVEHIFYQFIGDGIEFSDARRAGFRGGGLFMLVGVLPVCCYQCGLKVDACAERGWLIVVVEGRLLNGS